MNFEEVGTFEYKCGIQARMTGIISVRQEIDSPKDSTPEDDQIDTK